MTVKNKKTGIPFQLRPFAACSMAENLSISGSLIRRPGAVLIEYKVEGDLDHIRCPTTSLVTTGRCHELWRQTCFELFFAIKGEAAYWEVNLGLNDCWNVYHFTDYRTGMREERAVGQPVCRVVTADELLSLTCTMDFNGLIEHSSALEVAVSSVIQATDGSISYWAIDHHGPEPDFHNRTGFCVVLPGAEELNIE